MLLDEIRLENARKNFDNSFKRPRMDKKIISPTKKKLSCWDQNCTSIFMLVWEMKLPMMAVMGSVEPLLLNKVLIKA